jgi:hypothetical protein
MATEQPQSVASFRVGQRVRLAVPLGGAPADSWVEVTKATWSEDSGWYYTVRTGPMQMAQGIHQSALYLDAVTLLGNVADAIQEG